MIDILFLVIFLAGGVLLAFFSRKKDNGLFLISVFSGIMLTAYLLYLDISAGIILVEIPLAFLLLFYLSYRRNKPRLRNGLYFNLFLGSFFLYIGLLLLKTGNIFLGGIMAVLFVFFVLLAIFGIWGVLLFLYWNSFVILKKESRSLANLLTLILAVGVTLLLIANELAGRFLPDWVSTLLGIPSFMLFYFFIAFVNFLTISIIYQFNRPRYTLDYIVILGAGLLDGERVTPLLAGRIDRGIQFYKAQMRATLKPLTLLMSGGQGADEKVPEAIAMRQYALEQGVPADAIEVETHSTTTQENMRFSKEIMEAARPAGFKAVFASNDYHIFRAAVLARNEGLKIDGIGSKTAAYYLPNAFLREFIALIVMNKRRHLILCGSICGIILLSALLQLFVSLVGS